MTKTIPVIEDQTLSTHNNGTIRVFTREHEKNFYGPPFYRVDMLKPGDPDIWVPLTNSFGEVVYYDSLEDAVEIGVEFAEQEMESWEEN